MKKAVGMFAWELIALGLQMAVLFVQALFGTTPIIFTWLIPNTTAEWGAKSSFSKLRLMPFQKLLLGKVVRLLELGFWITNQ